jgi:hypothetical protein
MAEDDGGLLDRAMLRTAASVLAGRIAVPPRWRVRAAAVLGRTALEYAVRRTLRELTGASIGTQKTRHQLICLGELTEGVDWARDADWAWSALSSACHEHAYELEPTASEVGYLLALVDRVVNARVTSRVTTSVAG